MYHDYIERIREIVDYNSKPKSAIFRMPLLFKRRFDAKKEQRKATIKKEQRKATIKKSRTKSGFRIERVTIKTTII